MSSAWPACCSLRRAARLRNCDYGNVYSCGWLRLRACVASAQFLHRGVSTLGLPPRFALQPASTKSMPALLQPGPNECMLMQGSVITTLLAVFSFCIGLFRFRYTRFWFTFVVATFRQAAGDSCCGRTFLIYLVTIGHFFSVSLL